MQKSPSPSFCHHILELLASLRSVVWAAVLLVAACERPVAAPTQEASSSASSAAPALASGCPVTTPVLVLDAAYQSAAKEGFNAQFPTQTEEEILVAIRARHRHYLYTEFLDKFPQTASRPDIECRLRGFALFEAREPIVVSKSDLASRFNFEGELTKLGRWNKGLVFVGNDGIHGAPMIGNLQFIESKTLGGITVSEQGLEIPKNARFIYPTVKFPAPSSMTTASDVLASEA